MGSAIGAALRSRGISVLWVSADRSEQTAARACEGGFEDAGTVEELVARSDVILSITPPHAALDVARSVAGFEGVFVDANAIAPETAREVAQLVDRCVDGGIVGPPPRGPATTHLYLSGPEASAIAELFDGTSARARVVSDEVGAASAVKVAYAAWTKGTAALLLAIQEFARAEGVEPTLVAEWRESLPQLPELAQRARRSADAKGWRWVGEMEEIAAAFGAQGLPEGFHKAAADVYRKGTREWQHGVPS
jgi:3-hydroxyisobutyrate dehydrogenase-like beta-hydroxyacid dehydrogenase